MSWGPSVAASFWCCLPQFPPQLFSHKPPVSLLFSEPAAGDRVEQVWGHSCRRGDDTQLLRILLCQPQRHLRCCRSLFFFFCFSFVFQPDPEFHQRLTFSHDSSSSSSSQSCFHKQPLSCTSCSHIIEQYAGDVLRFVGSIGLFFSFTEVSVYCWTFLRFTLISFVQPDCVCSTLVYVSHLQIFGVWLSHRYRNLKDPRSNPGAFL